MEALKIRAWTMTDRTTTDEFRRSQVKQHRPQFLRVAASYLGCQHDTARICRGAVAAERRRLLSIDISCSRGAQQQTRRKPLPLAIDGTDRRTDGRSTVSIDPASHSTQ